MRPWQFPYIHRRFEDGTYSQGLNLQWFHGPRICWFWETPYHGHRWVLWVGKLPSRRWRVVAEYDDLDNPVRYIGPRFPRHN